MNKTASLPTPALGRRVLAERNKAAAAVGAWVESGVKLEVHPCTLAAATEEQQMQRRLRSEHHLRLFQENVRLRVAEQERRRRREQPSTVPRMLKGLQYLGGNKEVPRSTKSQQQPPSGAWVRQRLARPRLLEPEANLPHQEAAGHTLRDDEGPLTTDETDCDETQKCRGEPWFIQDSGQHEEAPDSLQSEREASVYRVLWPIDQSEELRRQQQTQILTQRRLFLSKDRQNVRENQEQKRHALRTASLKQEREHVRLQEEQRLGEERLLCDAQQRLQQREEQVQQTLRREEQVQQMLQREEQIRQKIWEEPPAVDKERGFTRPPKTDRLVRVLRGQLKELFSGSGLEPPPLCCCGSFWDSHPDTCANNCDFYHNPKAYVQALQTVLHSWQLL